MKKKNNKKLVLLLILVLVISVGYAALATTIKINGTSTVKGLNWNIYWDNVVPTEGSVTGANVTTAPTTNGTSTTTVTFGVILPEPGDFYEFTVDAVNAGSIDAMIADDGILKKAYSDSGYTQEVTLPDVVRYTVTDSEGNEIEEGRPLLKKSGDTPTRDTYKVRVEYRNDEDINPSDLDGTNDRTYYFKFEVEYVQKQNAGNGGSSEPTVTPRFAVKTRQTEGEITPGDELALENQSGDEEVFKVVSNSDDKIVMITKYTLSVGGEGATDLQNTTANYFYVPFSTIEYWYVDGPDSYHPILKSKYTDNGRINYEGYYLYDENHNQTCAYVYDDEEYDGEPGTSNYSVAYYIKRYKAKLVNEYGLNADTTFRLLNYEETISDTIKNMFKNDPVTFWTGNVYDQYTIVYAGSGSYGTTYNVQDAQITLRAVIEITPSDIK